MRYFYDGAWYFNDDVRRSYFLQGQRKVFQVLVYFIDVCFDDECGYVGDVMRGNMVIIKWLQ